MAVAVKICGITTPEAMSAAGRHGAAMVGVVFFPASPRHVPPDIAAALMLAAPSHVERVGLFVNPDDALVDSVLDLVPLDIIQLHGHEPPERVAEVRARTGRPVMKAVPIASAADVAAAEAYLPVADRLLFDARPPAGASRPGGNAVAFDWTLLAGRTWARPWLLAGGLTAQTLPMAVAASGARAVDVSSGVESAPGQKDPALIKAFLEVAAGLPVPGPAGG